MLANTPQSLFKIKTQTVYPKVKNTGLKLLKIVAGKSYQPLFAPSRVLKPQLSSVSQDTLKSMGMRNDDTEQLMSNLPMKRPNATTIQRRDASEAKLLVRGEVLVINKSKQKLETGQASDSNRNQCRPTVKPLISDPLEIGLRSEHKKVRYSDEQENSF